MSWIRRTVDSCEWRRSLNGDNRVACGLAQQLAGLHDPQFAEVSSSACEACCRNFPPSVSDPNPVVLSLLFQVSERIRQTSRDHRDLMKADRLRDIALQALPMTVPEDDDSIFSSGLNGDDRVSWPAVAETLPPPDEQTAERIAKWAVGITTAPRRLPTLEICLDSLARAGWSEVRLFSDDNAVIPPRYSGLPTTTRDGRVGAWPNFHLALLELYQRQPDADAFMMVQDDVLFYEHPGLREYLEQVLWPGQVPGMVSLFCSQLYAQDNAGWHRFRGRWRWGAQAFVFSRVTVREFLTSEEVLNHRTNPQNGLALIDTLIGKWADRNNIPLYFPTPSLVQHIGHTSTLWTRARIAAGRRAGPFAGDGHADKMQTRPASSSLKVPLKAETIASDDGSVETILDCLKRAEIDLPSELLRAENCIVTIANDGFERWLDDMLGSLLANGQCSDALVVVVIPHGSERCMQVARKYGVSTIRCRSLMRVNATFKSVMYSIGRVIDAKRFVCLDADMIVLESLAPLFAAIDSLPGNSVFACRESNVDRFKNLEHAFDTVYFGRKGDLQSVLEATDRECQYPLVVNDGMFAGSHRALMALDAGIAGLTNACAWVDELVEVPWRNQFIFNLMLARLNCGVELDPRYNLQLYYQDVQLTQESGLIKAKWNSHPVAILHFCSLGRSPTGPDKYPEWRGRYARVPDPAIGFGSGDLYGRFVSVLRTWVGRRGQVALRWSFYGLSNGESGSVKDPDVFPVFGLLHYLIRSSGCRSVLESGTGFGVSTACLASAVAHRPNGRVVTIDINVPSERDDLWNALPDGMRERIAPVHADSLVEMDRLISQGDCFDAALLDSLHEAPHILKEFSRARQLVRPGGLILIHDVLLETGTVEEALRQIEAQGFGVTRLWTAEGLEAEDNALGLAVIENRPRRS